MKNAIIIYKSRKGTTKNFSENISDFLSKYGLQADVKSMEATDPSEVSSYDYIFLGCWTKGLYFILQHPEKDWIKFAEKLGPLNSNKTVLFTTYKLRTGTMFKEMIKCLKFGDPGGYIQTLKSRTGELPDSERQILSNFILAER
jgi:flavodoxin